MKTAFSYARVSTKEQAEKKNSIPEQFNRIDKFAKENNIQILKRFSDSDSAFHDENRNDFDNMIQLALVEKPDFIILDDSVGLLEPDKLQLKPKKPCVLMVSIFYMQVNLI